MSDEPRPTILIVEDEEELADTFARWLETDYKVIKVYSGEVALQTMSEEVDVVLLDRRLPDLSGGEVLERIRDAGYECRVAMITAVDPDFDILEMEFDDYVVKPVLQDDLFGIVERLLALQTYDEQVKQSFGLASKLAILESEKPSEELRSNEEYNERRDELKKLREEIDSTLADFEPDAFTIAYRDLGHSNEE